MGFFIGIVVVLGILIFFHELGHFLVAKAFGVGVERFSLGFGPRVAAKTVGRTEYRLSAIPLGGYVKMIGEQPDEVLDPQDEPFSFTHKHVAKRAVIVASGPVFNFFLAILIFFGVFAVSGTTILQAVVGNVRAGSPAAGAGIQTGDRIIRINQAPVESWSEMTVHIMDSEGRPLTLTVRRGDREMRFQVTPREEKAQNIFGEEQKRYIIGIEAGGEVAHQRLGIIEAFTASVQRTWFIIELTILSVVKIIGGQLSVKELGGPILIAQVAGQQAEMGMVNLLFFIALVSVNLGILNLLPVPVLDGGHLMFFGIEAVIGRPVSLKAREIAQQIGIMLLLMLMVFVIYNDIMRLMAG